MFNEYFDLTVGINQKGTLDLEDFVLQRQIRQSEKFREQEMIQMLEKLKLEDCIRIEKRVDEYKVNAAITLGILPAEQIAPLKIRKYTQVISVKEK